MMEMMNSLRMLPKTPMSYGTRKDLTKKEIAAGGVLDMDTHIVSTISSHGAGDP